MARSRSKKCASASARCPGRIASATLKLLKLFAFTAFFGASAGCASQQGTAFDRQLLMELEEKNVRLEAEVTRLREEKLRADRETACPDVEPSASSPSAEDEAPQDLPVVKVDPSDEDELPDGVASLRPAAPLSEEDPAPDGTRPVLKVHGKHEAWVYHRPLTAEDKTAKSVVPDPKPDKEDEQ